MNKDPETYEELIRKKRCIDLLKYYELSKEDLEKIYNFLEANPKGKVICGDKSISLVVGRSTANAEIIATKLIDISVDSIIISNTQFKIIPHYTYSSSDYSGGSSSNNNNNNNNNNNR